MTVKERRVAWVSSSLPVVIPETRANKFAHATPDGMHSWTNSGGTPALQQPPLHVMLPVSYLTAPDQALLLARV